MDDKPHGALILIIDDEPQIRRAVQNAIDREIGEVVHASNGRDGLTLAAARRPDLLILDLALPDMDGREVCREIRSWTQMPIIVLSARHSEKEKVALLDAGADDYVTKPFSPDELRARVRAQLRRSQLAPRNEPVALDYDGLSVDLARRSVSRDQREIHLTPIEWSILRTFIAERGRTLTHSNLFRSVWNQVEGDPQQYLRVHIANLRRKIETDALRPTLIITEPGVGYRFVDAA